MLRKSNHSPSRRWTWCDLHPTEFSVFRLSLIELLITGCLCMLEKIWMGLKFRKQDSRSGDLSSEQCDQAVISPRAQHGISGRAVDVRVWVCAEGEECLHQRKAVSWTIMSFVFMAGATQTQSRVCLCSSPAVLTGNGPIAWLGFALGSTQRGWRWRIISLWLSQGKKSYWKWADGHCLRFNPSVPVWQCLSECSAQECCKSLDMQGDGGFAMIMEMGEKLGREVG